MSRLFVCSVNKLRGANHQVSAAKLDRYSIQAAVLQPSGDRAVKAMLAVASARIEKVLAKAVGHDSRQEVGADINIDAKTGFRPRGVPDPSRHRFISGFFKVPLKRLTDQIEALDGRKVIAEVLDDAAKLPIAQIGLNGREVPLPSSDRPRACPTRSCDGGLPRFHGTLSPRPPLQSIRHRPLPGSGRSPERLPAGRERCPRT